MLRKVSSYWIILMLITTAFIIIPQNVTVDKPRISDSGQEAIHKGVAWLASQQNVDGSWGRYGAGSTGLVLTKLQEYAYEIGKSPFDEDFQYYENVTKGWEFIFSKDAQNNPYVVRKQLMYPQQHGTNYHNPDSNANGYGLSFTNSCYHTGICLMALEASGTPNRVNDGGLDFNGDNKPDTFFEIAQDTVDWIAYAQGDSGPSEGGWYYTYINNTGSSTDNSNSGYIVLGLAAGEEFGCTIPEWVKTELDLWIDVMQDPVDGDPNGYDGGSYYSPGGGSANSLRTANLIFEMTFYGDSPTTPRFVNATDYIERHWHNLSNYQGWGYERNPADYQTMFCLMKGLEYSGIDHIDLDNDFYPEHDWYNEFATVLISQQSEDGFWYGSGYGNTLILSTTWALIVIEKIIPPKPPEPFQFPPKAAAGGPYTCNEGSAILFNGSGTIDFNGDDLEYQWDFNGDGIWDTDWSNYSNATYAYGDDWIGMAFLKVREINTSKNYTSIDKALVTVKNVAPIVQSLPNITILENNSNLLYAIATDPGSDDLSFEWIWGGANISNNHSIHLNAPPNPDTYPSFQVNPMDIKDTIDCPIFYNGEYRVIIIVKDDDGDIGINYTLITVNKTYPEEIPEIKPPEKPTDELPNEPPIAILKADQISGAAPLRVFFNGIGYDTDGIIVSHNWDFGDDKTYSAEITFPKSTLDAKPFHKYSKPGIYNVTFTITDDDGATDEDTLTIEVTEKLQEVKTAFTISGYVYKFQTSKKIAHVNITTMDILEMTDYSGYYSITVPTGTYILNVSKNGYESTSTMVTVISDININFYLKPIERDTKEVESTFDYSYSWMWIIIFVIIIVLIITYSLVKKIKKYSKEKSPPEPVVDKFTSSSTSKPAPQTGSKALITPKIATPKTPTTPQTTISTTPKPTLPSPKATTPTPKPVIKPSPQDSPKLQVSQPITAPNQK